METVDFGLNYDEKTQEPEILPARFPNLLANGLFDGGRTPTSRPTPVR